MRAKHKDKEKRDHDFICPQSPDQPGCLMLGVAVTFPVHCSNAPPVGPVWTPIEAGSETARF
jgi:hypothetical protein